MDGGFLSDISQGPSHPLVRSDFPSEHRTTDIQAGEELAPNESPRKSRDRSTSGAEVRLHMKSPRFEADGIDYREARERMSRVIADTARGILREQLEDVTHEALVGLVRAIRRQKPESLEALQVVIAKRAAIDWIREQKRERLLVPSDGLVDRIAGRDLAQETQHMFWVVREYFLQSADDCVPLFDARFEGHEFDELARAASRTSAAMRKQWSRCCEKAREALLAEGGALADWVRWAT
jgi:DNA-directed RNA polymerase specialized sigma24 family protein